jgi:hypothetical protein
MVDIYSLQKAVETGQKKLRITSEAQLDAFKEGVCLADVRVAFEYGVAIEFFPEKNWAVLYADLPDSGVSIPITVEETVTEAVIVAVLTVIPETPMRYRRRQRR